MSKKSEVSQGGLGLAVVNIPSENFLSAVVTQWMWRCGLLFLGIFFGFSYTCRAQYLSSDATVEEMNDAIVYAKKNLSHRPHEGIRLLNEVLQFADLHPEIGTEALLVKAGLFLDLSRPDSALHSANQALTLCAPLSEGQQVCAVYNTLSTIYYSMEDYDASEKMANKTVELAEKGKWPKLRADALYTLGSVYAARALASTGDSLVVSYSRTSRKYLSMIMSSNVEKYDKMITTADWALIESNLGNYFLADSLFKEAIEYFGDNGNFIMEANTWNNRAYNELDQEHNALALEYILNAWDLVDHTDIMYDKQYIAESVSEIFERAGRYPEALEFLKIFHGIKDSLATIEVKSSAVLIQSRLENQLLRAENEKAELRIRIQRMSFLGLGIVIAFMLLFMVSVIRQKRRKEALLARISEQNRDLEAHNQFKSRVISMISHDFRVPLNTLKSVIELANIGGLDKEDYRKLIAGLDDQLKETGDFLSKLLLWARVQIKGDSREPETFKLSDVIKSNENLLRRELDKKDITLRKNLDPEMFLTGDKEVVSMAFRNVLQNAIKFSPPSQMIDVKGYTENKMLTIDVRDYGEGMSLEKARDMFGDTGKSSRGTFNERGSGLGLTLTRDLVQSAGGHVFGKNYPGEGLCMSIQFPYMDPLTPSNGL